MEDNGKEEEIKHTEAEDEEEEVFLYDDNIPSIPTRFDNQNNGTSPFHRRNRLLRMISDPRSYNTMVLRALGDKRHRSESHTGRDRDGSR